MNKETECTLDTCDSKQDYYIKPQFEVNKGDAASEIRVYLPGVSKEDSTVALDDNTLTIEGRRGSHANADWESFHQEISDSHYKLKLKLQAEFNTERITAQSENGVLKITLPVAEKAKPRSITIG